MVSWTEGDIDSNGVSIHFYRTGQNGKPALILAHGLTDNGLCWARTAKALEADFDIVTVDGRNHGKSDRAVAGLKDLADDMAAVITGLGLDRPMAMGHSVGASVVAGLAAHYPQLVSRIVLEDPPWTSESQGQNEEKMRQRHEGFREYVRSLGDMTTEQIIREGTERHPTWHDEDFPAWAASKKQVDADAMALLQLGDWGDIVSQIQCPTLLIYADADRDGIVSQDLAKKIGITNNLISSHQVAGAGHNLRREQFDEFVEVAKAFLLTS